jgi:hypothetical protein
LQTTHDKNRTYHAQPPPIAQSLIDNYKQVQQCR